MDEKRRCQEDERPEPGSDLYTAERRVLSYKDFINKELVMFSYVDLERSVPSLVDGGYFCCGSLKISIFLANLVFLSLEK